MPITPAPRSSPRTRRILIGLAVLTIAQFAPWQLSGGGTVAMTGFLYESSLPTVGGLPYLSLPQEAISGWALHPLAIAVLPVLLAIYALDLRPGAFWPRYGLAITLVLMLVCALVSLNSSDWGALVGWLGIGIAASALRLKVA